MLYNMLLVFLYEPIFAHFLHGILLHYKIKLQAGEVIDASSMSVEELCSFYEREISDAKENDIMLSLVSGICSILFAVGPDTILPIITIPFAK